MSRQLRDMGRLRFRDDDAYRAWHAEQRQRSGVDVLPADSRTLATVEQILTDSLPELPQ